MTGEGGSSPRSTEARIPTAMEAENARRSRVHFLSVVSQVEI